MGIQHNTDKASARIANGESVAGHDFLRHYEAVIRAMPRPPSTVLDLGVGITPDEFASAKMWADYLPKARIVAVDIGPKPANCPEGIEFLQGDLGDLGFLYQLIRDVRADLVIEDASHRWGHQLLSLFYLLPAVQPGGIYIWEDIHVSALPMKEKFSGGLEYSPLDFLKLLTSELIAYRWNGGHKRTMHECDEAGIAEVMASSLAPMIDRLTLVPEAALFQRSVER